MNAVIGLAYLALKTALTDKQRDYLNKIHNAGTSLLRVINDILDFSKIEAGRLDIETVDFRLDDVIASATSITAQKTQDKGLEFLAEVESSVPQNLVGDPMRLGQVITNLINNAIKFTEQGEVYLKVELLEQIGDRARLRFSVKDTGIGMATTPGIHAASATMKCGPYTKIGRGGCGSAPPPVSMSSTGPAERSLTSPRRTGWPARPYGESWKTPPGISGWRRMAGSAGFTHRRGHSATLRNPTACPATS